MPLRPVLLVFALLLGKTLFSQSYHHNVFCTRLALADTINHRTKLELFFQKRTQSTAEEPGNPFKSNHLNSIWFWINVNVGKSSKISFSPFGYFENYALNAKPLDEDRPPVREYRISLRFTNELNGRIANFINRYSLEYRMRDLQHNGLYKTNFRARYMARLEKPVFNIFSRKKPVTFELSDEVFLQFGKAVQHNPNVFDQNRLYLGFQYEILKNVKTTIGYIYNIQERASGEEFDKSNMIWTILTFDNLFSQFKRKKTSGKG